MGTHHQLLLVALLAVGGASALPTKKATSFTNYRLPQIYSVSSYHVNLSVPLASLTTADSDVFSGNVAILFSLKANTDGYIRLHAQHEFIEIKQLLINGSIMSASSYSIDNTTDILSIEAPSALTIGYVTNLTIAYDSRLSTTDMYGFYKSSYTNSDDEVKYLATTQFESTYARRAFPCFDEPNFKAKFTLDITYPQGFNALFNTEVSQSNVNFATGLQRTVFKETMVMSTYLVAFIVSDFTCTTGETVYGVAHQVCSRSESSDNRALAVEVSPLLLGALSSYLGYNYSNVLSKMDQVAIPDFAAGAMENWGLVTYREADLLWAQQESSNKYRQRVTTVIAHEFTHQWFGNLVTMNWWSETFLNEGFATYFETHIAHELYPEWELDKQFVLDEMQYVFQVDATLSSQALQSSCSTPDEISSKFGTVSYSKGGAVFRMVEKFMGLENFKAGLNQYLTKNSFKNTEPEDLWDDMSAHIDDSISNLPADLRTVMENWVKKSGFPVLDVHVASGAMHISQERFLYSGSDTSSLWYVPISFTSSVDSNKFETTSPSTWLTPSDEMIEVTIPSNAEWVIVNNKEAGYYRVNYDSDTWDNIATALLSSNFSGIVDLNRAQIIDDLFNLARAGYVTYSKVFSIVQFLANETTYFSWYPAFDGYSFLLKRVGYDSELGAAISSELLTLMDKVYNSMSFEALDENDQVGILNQVQVLTWACKLGEEICIEESVTRFASYKSTNTRPHKNLRSVVYCNALRYGNDSSDWTFLWNAYLNASGLATEQVTILTALGCTKNTTILEEYLQIAISDDSPIRLQDTSYAFSAVYAGNPEGIDVAFDFLVENYLKIAEKLQGMGSLSSVLTAIAGRFTTEEQITKLEQFVAEPDLPEALALAAESAVETAKANLEWVSQYKSELNSYYDVSGAGRIGNSLIGVLLVVLLVKFIL